MWLIHLSIINIDQIKIIFVCNDSWWLSSTCCSDLGKIVCCNTLLVSCEYRLGQRLLRSNFALPLPICFSKLPFLQPIHQSALHIFIAILYDLLSLTFGCLELSDISFVFDPLYDLDGLVLILGLKLLVITIFLEICIFSKPYFDLLVVLGVSYILFDSCFAKAHILMLPYQLLGLV